MPRTNDPMAITPRQLDVLNQIEAFQNSRCYSATIGELAIALNVSRPTVFEHIAALREKKLIAQSSGKARCLHLTPKGKRLIDTARRLEDADTARREEEPDVNGWTLAGRVCAGYGIEAIEDPQPFSVETLLNRRQDQFVLKVTGDSMKDAGILDGDYILCAPSATAENGQIVVAMLDGRNATLKRFYKDARTVRLQPANDAFEPILSRNCTVRAVVTGVIRKLAMR